MPYRPRSRRSSRSRCASCGRPLGDRYASDHDALADDLRDAVENMRDRVAVEGMGPAFQDEEFITDPDRIDRQYDLRGPNPDVLMTFDGDAYEYFSLDARFPESAADRVDTLERIGERHGYRMERIDNVTIGFFETR